MASAAEQLAANLNFGAFQKATELHKRIGFTLIALIIYRLGTHLPIPGIDSVRFAAAFAGQQQGILGTLNLFSGGAVENMAIFALNVMPYISASIIVQLLQTVYPPWEKLKKEGGEAGRKQLNQYTRYLTVVLALFQAAGIAFGLQSQGMALTPGVLFLVSTIVTLTGGTLFLMWLGEQITSRGVGNGISLIIFAGIVAVLPRSIFQMFEQAKVGSLSVTILFGLLIMAVAVVLFIVFMERSQRRLLIQYPKRQQGNRMVGGESSFLPLKINTSGVIPPIFASSLLLLPTTVLSMTAGNPNQPGWMTAIQPVLAQLQHGQPLFMALFAALIIFFCFFYTSIVFNPEETAENLRKYGGFMPGIRPGKRTAEYLDFVLTRLTVIGAAYITAVCLVPEILVSVLNAPPSARALGGTSILIVVSVTMDTVAQIQSHLLAHQYEGLIKKSKLRGGKR
ncbi:MAG: preprotein translocase subunit SecY [Caulobacter sp.]|jgi:preprotein translocase subunit SecY|nr:preprotein translocase subunit SecY [Caulobacter sp.]